MQAKRRHLYACILRAREEAPGGPSARVVVPVVRIPLEHIDTDPGEAQDIADVVVRRMDDVERRERRSVPHLSTKGRISINPMAFGLAGWVLTRTVPSPGRDRH